MRATPQQTPPVSRDSLSPQPGGRLSRDPEPPRTWRGISQQSTARGLRAPRAVAGVSPQRPAAHSAHVPPAPAGTDPRPHGAPGGSAATAAPLRGRAAAPGRELPPSPRRLWQPSESFPSPRPPFLPALAAVFIVPASPAAGWITLRATSAPGRGPQPARGRATAGSGHQGVSGPQQHREARARIAGLCLRDSRGSVRIQPVPTAWPCLPETPEGASPGRGQQGDTKLRTERCGPARDTNKAGHAQQPPGLLAQALRGRADPWRGCEQPTMPGEWQVALGCVPGVSHTSPQDGVQLLRGSSQFCVRGLPTRHQTP